MPDKEKAIKGVSICLQRFHCGEDCPYYNDTKSGCMEQLREDALALLKEQKWHLLMEDTDGIIHGLPGDDGQYLMTDGKEIWIDDYVDGVDDGIWLDSGRDIREIKAWMHKPGLPKQEGR